MNKEKFKAFFALFIATFFWGSAYIFVKQLLNNVSPYMILALRFCFAAIILIIIYNKKLLKINLKTLKAGIIMGIFLFGEFFYLYCRLAIHHHFQIIIAYCFIYYIIAICLSDNKKEDPFGIGCYCFDNLYDRSISYPR